jgi:hypothetical protein
MGPWPVIFQPKPFKDQRFGPSLHSVTRQTCSFPCGSNRSKLTVSADSIVPAADSIEPFLFLRFRSTRKETPLTLVTNNIDSLKPKAKDYRKADGGGLYLLIRTTGSKLWRYDYRLDTPNGVVRRTLAIGEYSKDGDGKASHTLAQARVALESARQAVDRGEHPVSPTKAAAAVR